MSRSRRRPSAPSPLVRRLSRPDLEAAYDRLASECDRLAGRIMILDAQVRDMGRANARFVTRTIQAERRAQVAEAALTAATTSPAAMARLILDAERLLYLLSYPTCAACRAVTPPHAPRCRIDSLLAAIQREIPV